MADTLKQLGREIGHTHQSVNMLQRRGGALPQIDRTRGFLRTTTAFIAPFIAVANNRKMSVSIDFTEGK